MLAARKNHRDVLRVLVFVSAAVVAKTRKVARKKIYTLRIVRLERRYPRRLLLLPKYCRCAIHFASNASATACAHSHLPTVCA